VILNEFSKFGLIEVKKLNDELLDPTIEDFARYLLTLTDDAALKRRILEIIKKGREMGFRGSIRLCCYYTSRKNKKIPCGERF